MGTWVVIMTAVVFLVLLLGAVWVWRHSPTRAADEGEGGPSRRLKELADYNYWNWDL